MMNSAFTPAGARIAVSRSAAILLFATLALSMNGWSLASPLFENSLLLIGWILIAVGVIGRQWCIVFIGGRKNAELVTVGPYSISRNPLYLFSFIGGLGVMLVTETLLLPFAFCVLFATYYSVVMASEENTLRRIHGVAFDDYFRSVPQFWPQFDLLSEPESYMISTRQLRKGLADTAWFIIAGAAIQGFEALHAARVLPTLIYLY